MNLNINVFTLTSIPSSGLPGDEFIDHLLDSQHPNSARLHLSERQSQIFLISDHTERICLKSKHTLNVTLNAVSSHTKIQKSRLETALQRSELLKSVILIKTYVIIVNHEKVEYRFNNGYFFHLRLQTFESSLLTAAPCNRIALVIPECGDRK